MLPSRPKAVLISLVASYLLSALLLFILAFVLYKLKLKESQIAPAVYALYAISCFAGGLLCGKALRTRRFLGASHRSSVFSGALYGIPSAAPRAGTRAFPDTSGTGLLRGRRHGRRNFKLMKKKGMQQS